MRTNAGNNPLLSRRGLLTMNQTAHRENAFLDIASMEKCSNAREDAYLWLSSASEAALAKQFVTTEEDRVRAHNNHQADLASSINADEISRFKATLTSEYSRLLKDYDHQKKSLASLFRVNLALAKGSSESIARQLRSFLKSNDDPADRVKLFWEIKNSVDRFTSRRKHASHKHNESIQKFQDYKKKCIQVSRSIHMEEAPLSPT